MLKVEALYKYMDDYCGYGDKINIKKYDIHDDVIGIYYQFTIDDMIYSDRYAISMDDYNLYLKIIRQDKIGKITYDYKKEKSL